jgi:hypothetical protein
MSNRITDLPVHPKLRTLAKMRCLQGRIWRHCRTLPTMHLLQHPQSMPSCINYRHCPMPSLFLAKVSPASVDTANQLRDFEAMTCGLGRRRLQSRAGGLWRWRMPCGAVCYQYGSFTWSSLAEDRRLLPHLDFLILLLRCKSRVPTAHCPLPLPTAH